MSFPAKLRYAILSFYFLSMCILFCLPGSAFPTETWLNKVWFDKWVHIGLFSGFTFLVSWTFLIRLKKGVITIFIIAVIYGLIVEFVQDQFIPNRSFDLADWGADIIGSLAGIWFWYLRYIKK